MSKDIHAPISCLIIAILIPMVVIIYDLWLSEYPRTLLWDPTGRVLLALFFIPSIIVSCFLFPFLKEGFTASYSNVYFKVLTLPVGNALEKAMPLSARPVERTTGGMLWLPPYLARLDKYRLSKIDGVRITVKAKVFPDDERVMIEVFTSDPRSRATRDIIEACTKAMSVMGLDEPPIDQDAEISRLEEHRKAKPKEQEWSYIDNAGSRFSPFFAFVPMGVFVTLIGFLAIFFGGPEVPPPEILLLSFWFGPALILMAVYFMFPSGKKWVEEKERIYYRHFDARMPFVSGSIKAALDRHSMDFQLSQHTFLDVKGRCDVFVPVTQGEQWVRIEVRDSSWIPGELETSISIMTSWGYAEADRLKRLVDEAVMRGL